MPLLRTIVPQACYLTPLSNVPFSRCLGVPEALPPCGTQGPGRCPSSALSPMLPRRCRHLGSASRRRKIRRIKEDSELEDERLLKAQEAEKVREA